MPARDLVPHHEPHEELGAVARGRRLVLEREQRREDDDAGMALGQAMPVMRIVAVDRRGAGHRRARQRHATPVEDHARAEPPAQLVGRGEVVDDARHRRPASAGGDAREVEQAHPRAVPHLRRNVRQREPMDEIQPVAHRRSLRSLSCST